MSLVPQAKIAVPQLPPGFVVRAGLRADLDAAGGADVALVCAPAGYGKTMLLADWARAEHRRPTGPTVRHRLGEPGSRRQRPEAVVDGGRGRARRLPVGAAGQPPARPLGVATRRPAGVPRRARRRRAAAAPADPADPRRRARARRPGRPARPADPAAQPPHRFPARPVQPVRPAVVASPAAPRRPAVRAARRPVALLPRRDGHPARTIRTAPHPRRRSRPCTSAPAAGSPGCGWPHSRSAGPPTATRSSTSSPATTARSPTTWSGRSSPRSRRTCRSSCG